MAAASGGYAEIVKLLLAKGADVSAKDQQGRTAFSMAEAAGESQVADLLRSEQLLRNRHASHHRAEAMPRRSFRFTVSQRANRAAQRLIYARAVTDLPRVNLADSWTILLSAR